ncbi:MAG: DUF4169 family protein [Rhodobacteraceae bacterium]|nr:DUF4169 family protein [Paracoccaceae bacterium]
MNGKVLSLSKARKTREMSSKRAQADENAVKFGLTKAQKKLNKAQLSKSAEEHDDHRREE